MILLSTIDIYGLRKFLWLLLEDRYYPGSVLVYGDIWETLIEIKNQDPEAALIEEILESEVLADAVGKEKCIKPFVVNVVRIVRFLLCQQMEGQFIAANVLKKKMEGHRPQETSRTEAQEGPILKEEMI